MFLLEYWILNYKNYFDKHTEVLTDSGWKLIKDVNLDTDLVAQFEPTYNIRFVTPKSVDTVQNYQGKMITITSSSGLSLLTVTVSSDIPHLNDYENRGLHIIKPLSNINLEDPVYLYTAGRRITTELPELFLDVVYTKEDIDLIQSNSVIRGYSLVVNDAGNSAYYLNTNTAPFDSNDIVEFDYTGSIHTLSISSGMLVTRRFNKVVIGCVNV